MDDGFARAGIEARPDNDCGDCTNTVRQFAVALAESKRMERAEVDDGALRIDVAAMEQNPPRILSRPKRASRTSRCRMPLSSGRIIVSRPIAGANETIALSRS